MKHIQVQAKDTTSQLLLLCCLCVYVCHAVEARSMEQAIDALQSLGVSTESPAVDKHPEK
jgi:hypothetical protein